jgi:serine/threonine protein kinase
MIKKESFPKKIKRAIFILRLKPKLFFLKREFSITNLQPYIRSEWHHGFAFFIGHKDHKKIFLKISTKYFYLHNDFLATNILGNQIRMPKITNYYFKNSFEAISFEFIEGYPLTEEILGSNPNIAHQMLGIVGKIHENKIFHRDIKLNNFIIKDDDLYVIDFTFSASTHHPFKELNSSIKKENKILNSIGNGLNPEKYHWNDKFSINLIMNNLLKSPPENFFAQKTIEKICESTNQIDKDYSYFYNEKN